MGGQVVFVTGVRWVDLLVGAGIGVYVIREALEILGAGRGAPAPSGEGHRP